MSKIIDCITSSLGPMNSLVNSIPEDVPGTDTVKKFVYGFIQEWDEEQGRLTYNEMQSLFYTIFHLAASKAFNSAQGVDSDKDTLAYQMPTRDNYGKVDSFFMNNINDKTGFVDYLYGILFDCYCSMIDAGEIDYMNDDDDLRNILCESLMLGYKAFYTQIYNDIVTR